LHCIEYWLHDKTLGALNVADASGAVFSFEAAHATSIDLSLLPGAGVSSPGQSDFSRNTYGLMGIPVDAVSIADTLQRIEAAVEQQKPTLLSTPNLNFLTTSLRDSELRRSVMLSALCPVDGVPLVWLSKLLGIPIHRRVAGSDIFQALKTSRPADRPLRVFFFGGRPGIADAAAAAINSARNGLRCVGTLDPGFGSVEQLSTPEILTQINASGADFLIVALGAQKGQAWLLRNHEKIKVPVRSHLGAVLGFQSGKIKRAPVAVRKLGLEWLWRIKEEPYLFTRYWRDGCTLLNLMISKVVPLILVNAASRVFDRGSEDLSMSSHSLDRHVLVSLLGTATDANLHRVETELWAATERGKDVWIDLSAVKYIDARLFGLFLLLWKKLNQNGHKLRFVSVPRAIQRLFGLNAFDFLLDF
jgi:N-acetylglucosaminyldiphosphoundecaprenol N-acetyl-beta-D-mannosaminyltransferase